MNKTVDINELVKRLRDGFITMECEDDVVRYTNHVAADALEAMAGEVERLKGALEKIVRAEYSGGAKTAIARSALEAKP